jgi:hypothetical protein
MAVQQAARSKRISNAGSQAHNSTITSPRQMHTEPPSSTNASKQPMQRKNQSIDGDSLVPLRGHQVMVQQAALLLAYMQRWQCNAMQ